MATHAGETRAQDHGRHDGVYTRCHREEMRADGTTIYVCGSADRRRGDTGRQCIKFRTSSSIYLNRFEALNLVLMQKMQNRCADPTPPPPAAGLGAELGPGSATASRAASPMPQTQAGVVGGGTKKKKAKKKK